MEELSPANAYIKRMVQHSWRILARGAKSLSIRKLYLIASLIFLLATTIIWSYAGAWVQLTNADQLSDPYLFSDWHTFHNAIFPSAHTFLLKWPIFWLVSLFGVSAHALVTATVAVVLITVAVLAFVVSRIVRRPLVLGSVYLLLAFVLLLIPAQPYAGGLLPVNMAMLTTRNLEYAVYIVALIMLIRGQRLRNWWFIGGTALLALLIASDKLFLAFSLGGAALTIVLYALISNWRMVAFAVRWLVASGIAAIVASLLLMLLTSMHITNISSAGTLSPYGTDIGLKSLSLGLYYGITGLLTNFGANPIYDNRVITSAPHDIISRIMQPTTLLYLGAFVIFAAVLFCTWRLLRTSFRKTLTGPVHTPLATQLSVTLVCSTVVAGAVFIASDHYYAVDSRYLTIGLFAGVIASCTALRRHPWRRPKWLLAIGMMTVIASGFAIAHTQTLSNTQKDAYISISKRNEAVSQALRRHKVDVLVGDYWRVLPIKFASHGSITAMPLIDCTSSVPALTSGAWKPDLSKHSFAYLVSVSGGTLTNYPNCSLEQITKAYGHPNSLQVIAGSIEHPQEALLFYDDGSHPNITPKPSQPTVASLLPVDATALTKTNCIQPTVMNVVAHEDDDLLFMNPDLLHELDSGTCVRTVFMTAGDSGYGKFYWLSRQLGAEAAYSTMLGIRNVWDQQTLAIAPGQYVTVATPRDSNQVSLLFLNLPDGDLHGEGFDDSGSESLQKLHDGTIPTLHAVDGQSSYTNDQLTEALAMIMALYQPADIHTQGDVINETYPDHSDHVVTGSYAQSAASLYSQRHFGGVIQIPVERYIGYPIRSYDSNVSGKDLERKEAAFFAYAAHDGGVCSSIAQCAEVPTYDAYLSRQYIQ